MPMNRSGREVPGLGSSPMEGRYAPVELISRCGCGYGPNPNSVLDNEERQKLNAFLSRIMAGQEEVPTLESLQLGGRRCEDVYREPYSSCDDDEEDGDDDDYYEDEEPWQEVGGDEGYGRARSASPRAYCGFRKSFLCQAPTPLPGPSPLPGHGQDWKLLDIALPQKHQLTAEEAEKLARELVAEEERVKKKAEKKRLKKKRQKDRKRQEKRDQELKTKSATLLDKAPQVVGKERDLGAEAAAPSSTELSDAEGNPSPDPSNSPSQSPEEESEDLLDLTSTFVSKARRKVGVKPPGPRKEKAARPEEKQPQEEVSRPDRDLNPVEQSMALADCGTSAAERGCYQEAVLLFTEAVKLNPREHRLFGNRSFCYERLQLHAKALSDAELALSLEPGWPKGLFRKGKALMGLKHYSEAAHAFRELLQLDAAHREAAFHLERCRVQLTLANGLSTFNSSRNAGTELLPGALASQVPPLSARVQFRMPAGFGSSAGHSASVVITRSRAPELVPPGLQRSGRIPVPPLGPSREWFAVWVGNLTPKITQKMLLDCFQLFGPIHSIRLLPEKYCAFVNYTRKEAAEAAYVTLQGTRLQGTKLQLQLKHPVHATPRPAAPSGLRKGSWRGCP